MTALRVVTHRNFLEVGTGFREENRLGHVDRLTHIEAGDSHGRLATGRIALNRKARQTTIPAIDGIRIVPARVRPERVRIGIVEIACLCA